MPVRGPMLLHRMALVSFRPFCKNLGNLQEFFGQMVYRPPWPKIARTPMSLGIKNYNTGQLRYFDNILSRTSKQTEMYFVNCILIK